MLALIVCALLLYGLIALLRPEWAVYAILAFLPAYQIRFTVFNLPTTLLEGFVLILVLSMVLRIILDVDPSRTRLRLCFCMQPWFVIWLGLFLAAAGVAVAVSPQTIQALGIFKAYFLEGALFWLVCCLVLDSPQKQLKSFYALFILLLALSVFGFYQFFTLWHLPPSWWGPGIEPRRIVSLYTYPNAVALLLAPILTLASGVLVYRRHLAAGRSLPFLVGVLICGSLLLGLTFSRGGWLGFGAGMLILGLLSQYRIRIIALLLIGILLLFLVPSSRSRLLPVLSGADPAGQERLKLYEVAIDTIRAQPFLGTGLMGFRSWYGALKPSLKDDVLNYPHNIFLNFWVEIGIFGLIAMFGMISSTFTQARKLMLLGSGFKSLAGIVVAVLITILVHGLVDAPFFKNDLSLFFWYILSLLPAAKISLLQKT